MNGVATSPGILANKVAGAFTVTAPAAGAPAAVFVLTNVAARAASVAVGAAGGSSTTVGTRFAVPLAVTVTDKDGNPVAHAKVVFSAPKKGASGRFTHERRRVSVTTGVKGIAVAPRFTANDVAGGFVVTVRVVGSSARAAFALVNVSAVTEPVLEFPRLRLSDLARVASVGLRTRRVRAALSALGIAIGVAAIVAVLGLSSSSQAGLLAEIDKLGTNLLTVTNGQTLFGQTAELPLAAPGMIARIGPVLQVQETGSTQANVYRSPLIPSVNTNALAVQAASLGLPAAVGAKVAQGGYLNAATAREPVAVLGYAAAQRLGIDRLYPGERVWLGGEWFYLSGILASAPLAPEIDSSVLVGFPAAQRYLDFDGHPTTIYVRTVTSQTAAVYNVLASTAYPEAPNEVQVSQPSDVLTARAETQNALNSLFLGLGAVSLLVGAVGVGNIMLIGVLERRSEIGLRRSLGATKRQIRTQFLSEAILLALLGGAAGVAAGAASTAVYAATKHWTVVVPTTAWAGGLAAAIVIGAVAGLLPAIRAARMSPTEALRTV